MKKALIGIIGVGLTIAVAGFLLSGYGQTKVKPGFNLFSIEQEVELGRHAAQEVEQKFPLLSDAEAASYISDLGSRLARHTSQPNLPWQFKMVNAAEVNAFALPGGFVYVNRGLLQAAETEGQLVGVLAHEISHVTLRHGTNQMSKAMGIQAPLAILGGAVGDQGLIAKLTQLGIGVGANLTLLKFSRTAETQADVVGVQLMARSGYDPQEMGKMFEILDRQRRHDPNKLELWFSSHPQPGNRIGRINQEIREVRPPANLTRTSTRFNSITTRLRSLPPPPKPPSQGRTRFRG